MALRTILIYGMIYLGSALMLYNIFRYVQFRGAFGNAEIGGRSGER